MLRTKDISMLPTGTEADKMIERADKFYTECMAKQGMTIKILTKRFYIKGFNAYAKSISYEVAFEALKQLSLQDFLAVKEDDDFIETLKIASSIRLAS